MTRRLSLAALGVAAIVLSLLLVSGYFSGHKTAEAAAAPPAAPAISVADQGCTFVSTASGALQVTCVGQGCDFSGACYGNCGYLCFGNCGVFGGCFNNCAYAGICAGCAAVACTNIYNPAYSFVFVNGVSPGLTARVAFVSTTSKGTCGSSIDLTVAAWDANGLPVVDGTTLGATSNLGSVSKSVSTEDGLATIRLTVDPKVAGTATVTVTAATGASATKDIVYTCG